MEEKRIACLCEAVYDLSLHAQFLIGHNEVHVEDSRELFESIFGWAKEFEDMNLAGDHMTNIEEFGYAKLLERYGKERNQNH